MMKSILGMLSSLTAVLTVLIIISGNVFAQNISNEGTDFWATFPTHDPNLDHGLANINIFITSKSNSEVTVSCGGYTETKTIPANTVVSFAVPRDPSYVNASEGNTVLTNRGIRIKVTAGNAPVAVYAHVYAGVRSAATLILPYEALGQKYFSMNYRQDNNGRNFLALVAADDNTVLKLTEKSGTVRTITLPKAGDVYEYYGARNQDFTGVYVEVDAATSQCKRFAAFSGSTSLVLGCAGTRDPLLQQLYATTSWGKNYAVVPFKDRRSILRVLAQEDNTVVDINGASVTLDRGDFHETAASDVDMLISSNKLISVAQYSLSQECSSPSGGQIFGDADMIMLNPIEFSIKKITLFSSDKQAIRQRYINVAIKTESKSSFKINGAAPSGTWQTFSLNADYSYIQILANQESITLSANDGFNAIAYGFGSAESYGYSAGTSLSSNQYINPVSKSTGLVQTNACINQAVTFKVTMPFRLTRVLWTFGDDNTIFDDTAPVPVVRVVNGENLYDYSVPIEKTYSELGPQVIKAKGYFPAAQNSCFVGSADFEFNFNVDPYPTASFEAVTTSCVNTEVSFTDLSVTNYPDRVLKKWLWDFGDGNTSTLQNPKHTFTRSGIYIVKLITATESGCYSDVFSKEIRVNALPVVDFTVGDKTCEKQATIFTNLSASADGTIASYLWDFGDGTTSTEEHPAHVYASYGNYDVKLTVVTSLGCVLTKVQRVGIESLPVLDFSMPIICNTDGVVTFVNNSTSISDVPAVYTWNFGDVNATIGNPNTSNSFNGQHNYTREGVYEVTLTARSSSGCIVSLVKQFRVNGVPSAATFEVQDAPNLCSNKPVIFKDLATITFGEFTKIEWYFDYANKQTPDLIDENPNQRSAMSKTYSHLYPSFSNLPSKSYQVKMKVYSGNTCMLEAVQTITLSPEPSVNFDLSTNCLVNGEAEFVNNTSYLGAGDLTYKWNFGDAYALANENVSSAQHAKHRYSVQGTYNVSLTVANQGGCEKMFTKQVVVAGAAPIADFEVQNANSLCSQLPVSFIDKSSLGFGEITKIEWYFDDENQPTQVVTDLSPGTRTQAKVYQHVYPLFHAPTTKVLKVKMVVYAGTSCVAEVVKEITLKALPALTIGAALEICEEAQAIQLAAAELNGLPGSGIYSGAGVSSTGNFNPARAGVGAHTVTYTYHAQNGCIASVTQLLTVRGTPFLSAGRDIEVYEGIGEKIFATATGDNLTYKWTPSTGLDRDDVLNPIVLPTKDMVYKLTATSASGCVSTDEVEVKLLRNLKIPKTITPNGDGINDVWNIGFLDNYTMATVEIFDRSGQVIYKNTGDYRPFDGTYKGAQIPVGVYYYMINLHKGKKPLTGTLTIMR